MSSFNNGPCVRRRQDGIALVVGLVLLLAITILAVTGVMMATGELRMAASYQRQERAFQAAEAGVESGIYRAKVASLATTSPTDPTVPFEYVPPACVAGTTPDAQVPTINAGTEGDQYCYRLRYVGDANQTTPPVEGYSLGSAIRAFHYEVDSTGESDDGRAEHAQGFYIIGPAG
jgi:Tfp pilus assembly protein PilX